MYKYTIIMTNGNKYQIVNQPKAYVEFIKGVFDSDVYVFDGDKCGIQFMNLCVITKNISEILYEAVNNIKWRFIM